MGDELINKCFRILKRRGQSWGNSCVNLTRDRNYGGLRNLSSCADNKHVHMVSVDDPIHPDQSLRKNVSSKKLINTLSVPMGNKSKNKSSPDIYDELLVRQLSKESATNE